MNATTNAIARHLSVPPAAIRRVEEWDRVLFAVVHGKGGRFVSKRVLRLAVKPQPKQPQDERLTFGKYCGQTLSEIARNDPSYVWWLSENARSPQLRRAAAALHTQTAAQDLKTKPLPFGLYKGLTLRHVAYLNFSYVEGMRTWDRPEFRQAAIAVCEEWTEAVHKNDPALFAAAIEAEYQNTSYNPADILAALKERVAGLHRQYINYGEFYDYDVA